MNSTKTITINNFAPPLEIHVHLEDGRCVKFAQDDHMTARQLLNDIQPSKVFTEDALLLNDRNTIIAFQPSTVVRVDFITDMPTKWPLPQNILDVQEITPEEFRERYRPAEHVKRTSDRSLRNSEWSVDWMLMECGIVLFAEMELVTGAQVFLQIRAQPDRRFPLEHSILLRHIFSAKAMHARRHDGIVLINPACVTRLTFHMEAISPPPGVWQATCISA